MRRTGSIPLLEQTLAGRQQALGADHPDTEAAQANLDQACQEPDRPPEIFRPPEPLPVADPLPVDQFLVEQPLADQFPVETSFAWESVVAKLAPATETSRQEPALPKPAAEEPEAKEPAVGEPEEREPRDGDARELVAAPASEPDGAAAYHTELRQDQAARKSGRNRAAGQQADPGNRSGADAARGGRGRLECAARMRPWARRREALPVSGRLRRSYSLRSAYYQVKDECAGQNHPYPNCGTCRDAGEMMMCAYAHHRDGGCGGQLRGPWIAK